MLYRGTLASIHLKFRLGTPQSSWKTWATRRRKKRKRAKCVGRTANRIKFRVSERLRRRKQRDCWLQGENSGSEGNIKYCSPSPSVLANPTTTTTTTIIQTTITTGRPFHFARRHELPVQYTSIRIETRALKRYFINFVHALKAVDKTTSQNRCSDLSSNCSRRLSRRIYYPFESPRFFELGKLF